MGKSSLRGRPGPHTGFARPPRVGEGRPGPTAPCQGKEYGSAQHPGEEPGGRGRLPPFPRLRSSGVAGRTGIPETAADRGGARPRPRMPSATQSPGRVVALAPVPATLSAACAPAPGPRFPPCTPNTVASWANVPLPATLLLAVPGHLLLTLGPSAWVLPPPGSLLVCRDLRGGCPGEEMERESCPQPTWVQIPAAPHPGCAIPGRGCLLGASVSLLETRGWALRAAHVWAVTMMATMLQVGKLRHRGT